MDIEKDSKEQNNKEEAAPAKEEGQVHTLLLGICEFMQKSRIPSPCLTRPSIIRKQEPSRKSPKMSKNTETSSKDIISVHYTKASASKFPPPSSSPLITTRNFLKNLN